MRKAWLLALLLSGSCMDEHDPPPAARAAQSPAEPAPSFKTDLSVEVFREEEFNDFKLTMAPADWQSIIDDSRGDEWRVARLEWKDVVIDSVAVRPAGAYSRFAGNPKPSLKLKFNEFVRGQKFQGMKRLKLDGMMADDSLMIERVVYGLYRSRLPAAPRAVHGRLFVNGAYRGVYLVEESVDSEFVERRFGGSLGNLYRIRISSSGAYAWLGTSFDRYVPYPWVPQTNEDTADHAPVPRFLDTLHHDPADLGRVLDVSATLRLLAVELGFGYQDGVAGIYGSHNHYQYFRKEDARFYPIPWDVGGGWGNATRDIFYNFEANPLTALVLNDPALRDRYLAELAIFVENEWVEEKLHPRIDAVYAQIRDAVYADVYKPRSNDAFESSRRAMKRFVTDRRAYLRARLGV